MTFSSLGAALRAGFEVSGRSEHGYRVRIRTAAGWLFADVNVDSITSKVSADKQNGDRLSRATSVH
jgi:hypothetical protein